MAVLSDEQVKAARELADKATPGFELSAGTIVDWSYVSNTYTSEWMPNGIGGDSNHNWKNDANLFVAAKQLTTDLCDTIAALTAERDALKADVERLKTQLRNLDDYIESVLV